MRKRKSAGAKDGKMVGNCSGRSLNAKIAEGHKFFLIMRIKTSRNVIKVAAVAKTVSFSVILRVRCNLSADFADLLPGCPGLRRKVDSSPSPPARFPNIINEVWLYAPNQSATLIEELESREELLGRLVVY